MAPRRTGESSREAVAKPASGNGGSTSAAVSTVAAPASPALGENADVSRSGDDQQISQILAEMATQSNSPASRARRGAAGRAKTSSAQSDASEATTPTLASAPLPAPAANPGQSEDIDQLESPSREAEPSQAEATVTSPNGHASGSRRVDRRARGNSDEHKGMTEEEWEKSRKANHKEVERRRRETINAGLDALAALLPPPPPPPPGTLRPVKPNKSEILGQGINYIQQLKRQQQAESNKTTLEKLLKDQEIKKCQQELDKLREENERLKQRVEDLENSKGSTLVEDRDSKKRRLDDSVPSWTTPGLQVG
ncbi:uncharacterized protein JCM15063_004136 [Sporobolomyces koalae]|uniref:uncharacterized protein n=1 Tax=Sporobolomyces koalae TaxID=500713 RepID=UPI00317F5826